MKKLLAGTLTAAFALGLTACGQQEECSAKPVIYLYPEQGNDGFRIAGLRGHAHRDLSGV